MDTETKTTGQDHLQRIAEAKRIEMQKFEQQYLEACAEYSAAIRNFHEKEVRDCDGSKRATARKLNMSESQVRYHIAKAS